MKLKKNKEIREDRREMYRLTWTGYKPTSIGEDREEIPLSSKRWSMRIKPPFNKTLSPAHLSLKLS